MPKKDSTTTYQKTRGHPMEHWLKKLFPGKGQAPDSGKRFKERREFYRLKFAGLPAPDVTMVLDEGSVHRSSFKDLSAGGFCCQFTESLPVTTGERVHVFFLLLMNQPAAFRTQAFLVTKQNGDPQTPGTYRFRFSKSMDNEERDQIHAFILEKQLEWIRQQRG